ncbi:MAG: phosphatidylglycerophosphatase A [Woeseia sp.]|nr:phosphatidylglycerophosphatase A [Woeseia sp.]MBT8095529.1 phosphatidylglycerophosphatase A [Woeseia sp.]NNE59863.1 phosphatidylglycerophosphatase A [Woeseia sp.]NNL55854.1 phosphatidylglycerophosphatase A [Woeseia sp.]
MDNAELRRKVLTDPVHLLAFGFGTGLSPKAPGTVGSLVAILFGLATLPLPVVWQVAIGFAITGAGFWLCGESARRIGVHDHPGIVWDEIAALYLLLLLVPPSAYWWAAAFVLFRIFDIWKPWPIRDLDHRMRGGAGIMLDDLVAGLYAAIILIGSGWLLS